MDFTRDQLETRVATLELMLVTERARPNPDEDKISTLENELKKPNGPSELHGRASVTIQRGNSDYNNHVSNQNSANQTPRHESGRGAAAEAFLRGGMVKKMKQAPLWVSGACPGVVLRSKTTLWPG